MEKLTRFAVLQARLHFDNQRREAFAPLTLHLFFCENLLHNGEKLQNSLSEKICNYIHPQIKSTALGSPFPLLRMLPATLILLVKMESNTNHLLP